MTTCKNCERAGRQSTFKELPQEITKSAAFAKKDMPILLCPECDAFPIAAALRAHERRTSF